MTDAPTLFEMPDENSDQSNFPCVILSNRLNINEFRSRRIIVPKEGFSRHFSDLFDFTPHHIPIFQTPVSDELLTRSVAEGENNFPILIEIANHDVGTFPKAISFDDVIAFHFRSERDSKEFPRSYSNIPPDTEIPYKVSPELFDGGDQTLSTLETDKESLMADESMNDRLFISDKWSGAVSCAVFALNSSSQAQSRTSLELLSSMFKDDPCEGDKSSFVNSVSLLRNGIHSKLDHQDTDLASTVLSSVLRFGKPVDNLLFLGSLADMDPKNTVLRKIYKILDPGSEDSLYRFNSFGNDFEKALLLFLTSKTLDGLLKTASHQGAEPIQILMAAILFGLSIGRCQLPMDYRDNSIFDQALANIEIHAINETNSSGLINELSHEDAGGQFQMAVETGTKEIFTLKSQRSVRIAIEEILETKGPDWRIDVNEKYFLNQEGFADLDPPYDPNTGILDPEFERNCNYPLNELCLQFAKKMNIFDSVVRTEIHLSEYDTLKKTKKMISFIGPPPDPILDWDLFLETITFHDPLGENHYTLGLIVSAAENISDLPAL